jgi:putative oxidoreductase
MEDFGKLLLRVTVAGLLLFHGWNKIDNGIEGIKPLLIAKDIPEWVAYGVYVGEVAAPILMIIGFFTRIAALVVVINMAAAVWLQHWHQLGMVDEAKGGAYALELHALYLFGALAVVFLGPGKLSASGDTGKL